MGGGAQGFQARIGDGAGGEAGVPVGVVGILTVEIGTVDFAAVTALELGGVDHGGVAFELHAGGEAVRKKARDLGALVGNGAFFLDKRGEGDQLVNFLGGQV